jgi:hypothetical protein
VTKQIAHSLDISTKTVDFHRIHIMEKLGVQTVAELVRNVLRICQTTTWEKPGMSPAQKPVESLEDSVDVKNVGNAIGNAKGLMGKR